jgi:hypothetical protein
VAKFTYIPRFGDPENTSVMGVAFPGAEAVEVDETTEMGAALANKLRANGWFHEGDNAPQAPLTADAIATAKSFRDQARNLWLEAWKLDKAGTEADETPPQYVVDLAAKAATPEVST